MAAWLRHAWKTGVPQCDVCSHEDVICDDFADHMSKKHQVLLERHALPQDDDNDDDADQPDLIEIARKYARKYGPALSSETVAPENLFYFLYLYVVTVVFNKQYCKIVNSTCSHSFITLYLYYRN